MSLALFFLESNDYDYTNLNLTDNTIDGSSRMLPNLLLRRVLWIIYKATWVKRLLEQLERGGFPRLVHTIALRMTSIEIIHARH